MSTKIWEILRSGKVTRFHTNPEVTKQEVSAHSWGVAVICDHLFPNCSKRLLLACLYHDSAELVTGDIPAPLKWDNADVKKHFDRLEKIVESDMGIDHILNLSYEDKLRLKMCDMLEGMTYTLSKFQSGEKECFGIFMAWRDALENFIQKNEDFGDVHLTVFHDFYKGLVEEIMNTSNYTRRKSYGN